MQKPVILVTGKNGQLGNELQVLAPGYPQYEFVFTDLPELDITDESSLDQFFDQYRPSFCINAGAYTAVDKAETDKELTLRVNADAVGYLAKRCAQSGAGFVHISTDYVFNGTGSEPYREDDPTDPVNYYGFSKLKGEEQALQYHPDVVIIRTSWVYSFFGHNFVKTMRRLMSERDTLNVVNDQVGSPTYAADLAKVILQVVDKLAGGKSTYGGIYHFSNEGIISWYDFAVAVRDISGLSCNVNPVPSTAYPTPAKRPSYSGMSKDKITRTFGIAVPDWRNSLESCISILAQQQ
ncbi:dTDP-4-dehydrorhamnose reductase [Segetibacter sp. 3557_3]|uniref:dTDP-4-dehydrorhamnose reductase n=1 Tax=Segetibacter sp. 3557_3 TaxID=2547429 RepID=UPI001058BDEE|nr:dTDP-4-dehydrorhamnose reductase [Segetibacter sp. 3557_3]TDH27916.1 dTDP-4-dehydrorhamnose reductase [Segetibacter sp. 3557_3]